MLHLRLGLDLIHDLVETRFSPPSDDPALAGRVEAEVAVSLPVYYDALTHVEGTLSLRRLDGAPWLGIEVPAPIYGGLASPVRRVALSLDDVLDVVWTPGVWGGTLTVTPLAGGGLGALPTSSRGAVAFEVGRAARRDAEALAHAVALADLPA